MGVRDVDRAVRVHRDAVGRVQLRRCGRTSVSIAGVREPAAIGTAGQRLDLAVRSDDPHFVERGIHIHERAPGTHRALPRRRDPGGFGRDAVGRIPLPAGEGGDDAGIEVHDADETVLVEQSADFADVQIPVAIEREALRQVDGRRGGEQVVALMGRAAHRRAIGGDDPVGPDPAHAIVPGVGDVHVAGTIAHGECGRVELRLHRRAIVAGKPERASACKRGNPAIGGDAPDAMRLFFDYEDSAGAVAQRAVSGASGRLGPPRRPPRSALCRRQCRSGTAAAAPVPTPSRP